MAGSAGLLEARPYVGEEVGCRGEIVAGEPGHIMPHDKLSLLTKSIVRKMLDRTQSVGYNVLRRSLSKNWRISKFLNWAVTKAVKWD